LNGGCGRGVEGKLDTLAFLTSDVVVVLGIVAVALCIFTVFFGGGGFINGVKVIRAIQLELVILGLTLLVLVCAQCRFTYVFQDLSIV
jgi:hypothetical protein